METENKIATLPMDIIHLIADECMRAESFVGSPCVDLFIVNRWWKEAMETSRAAKTLCHVIRGYYVDNYDSDQDTDEDGNDESIEFDESSSEISDFYSLNEVLFRWIDHQTKCQSRPSLTLRFERLYNYADLIETCGSKITSLAYAEFKVQYFGTEIFAEEPARTYKRLPSLKLPPKLEADSVVLTANRQANAKVKTSKFGKKLRKRLQALELENVLLDHKAGKKFNLLKCLVLHPVNYNDRVVEGTLTSRVVKMNKLVAVKLLLDDSPNLQHFRIIGSTPDKARLMLPLQLDQLRTLDLGDLSANILDCKFPRLKTLFYNGDVIKSCKSPPNVKCSFEEFAAVNSLEVMKIRGILAFRFVLEVNRGPLRGALKALVELEVEVDDKYNFDEKALNEFKKNHPKLKKITKVIAA